MATKRLLIIDDDAGIREILQFCCEMIAGWQVLTAASGQEGITRAQLEQPDGIILDLVMPELDGWETLRRLRAHELTEHIPILFLTGEKTDLDREQFLNLGMVGVIAKPFEPKALVTYIREVFQWDVKG